MTTKPPHASSSSAAASSSAATTAAPISRRQPLRQARTKPPKNSLAPNTPGGPSTPSHQLPPQKFYPALTAFTDALDALPPETIRHFTLLREVDAKAFTPESHLRNLIAAAERLPPPADPNASDPALQALFMQNPMDMPAEGVEHPAGAVFGPETRRSRMAEVRNAIAELLVTQDEKIHVVTTANEALQKHLKRLEQCFAYVQVEIPAIYRLGSKDHWAYREPSGSVPTPAAPERSGRKEAEAPTVQQGKKRGNEEKKEDKGKDKRRKEVAAAPDKGKSKGTQSPRAGTPAVTHKKKKESDKDKGKSARSRPPTTGPPAPLSTPATPSLPQPSPRLPAVATATSPPPQPASKSRQEQQRYCYCDGPSYGEMVACDGDGCLREWFHLECVGLSSAPRGKTKWYCDDCRGTAVKA